MKPDDFEWDEQNDAWDDSFPGIPGSSNDMLDEIIKQIGYNTIGGPIPCKVPPLPKPGQTILFASINPKTGDPITHNVWGMTPEEMEEEG